ncbi:MAG: hypothetical protein KDE55_25120 [Novosphingobium sp.]|nr:hypothetical protein [Novosphingobium sp.]
MSNEQDPGGWVGRLFGWCLLVLLGAMALQGAMRILAGIWPWLTISAAIGGGAWLLIAARRRF